MAAGLLAPSGYTWLDNSTPPKPNAAGTITIYLAGTSTLVKVYSDHDQSSSIENPVNLDIQGRREVWLDSGNKYKIVVKDKSGTTLSTTDNVSAMGGNLSASLTADSDLDMGGYNITTTSNNYDIDIQPHGTGKTNIDDPVCKNNLDLDGNNIIFTSGDKFIEPSTSNELLVLSNPASAVNYPQLEGNTTGNNVKVLAKGDDTNIGITVDPKGTGAIDLNADTAVTGDLTVSADTTLSGDLDAPTLDEVTGPFNITGASATEGKLRLKEAPSTGSDYIELKTSGVLSSDVSFTLPDSDGTAGQYLKTDGSLTLGFASDPTEIVYLGSTSGGAVTSLIDTTYDTYHIIFVGMWQAGFDSGVQVSTDNGSSYESTNYYSVANPHSIAEFEEVSNGSQWVLRSGGASGNNNLSYGRYIHMELHNPSTSGKITWFTATTFIEGGSSGTHVPELITARGYWNSTTAVNAVKNTWGNSPGTAYVWGVKGS